MGKKKRKSLFFYKFADKLNFKNYKIMTGKEISELASKAETIIEKISREFKERINELYVIAQEKGHRCEFGWFEGEVVCPDHIIDDFETDEEYDEAWEKYETFQDNSVDFIWMDDHTFTLFVGYSFKIDEKGKVIFTSVRNEQDSEDLVWVDDAFVVFDPWLASNWRGCEKILKIIELEWEIE